MLMNLIYDFGLCTHELSWLTTFIHSDLASSSFLSGLNLEQAYSTNSSTAILRLNQHNKD